jgi:nucleotide sugar dehydrogenase
MKLLIIGHGFVGKAVDYGFTNPAVEKTIIDPKYGNSIKDVDKTLHDLTFVCVPTPMSDTGEIDTSILEEVLDYFNSGIRYTHQLLVIKSTVTPEIIAKYAGTGIVYNPEFLREKTANEDFVNPDMHIFGGTDFDCIRLELYYSEFSLCKRCPIYNMTAQEASFVKYGINSFLATKVTFFNELYDAAQAAGANFNVITKAMEADPRLGTTHNRVPGFDGKRGFGGACFPKDTAAFTHYTDKMTLLKEVIRINNNYRKNYTKDSRETEQNIQY